jgi:hypothetical protein
MRHRQIDVSLAHHPWRKKQSILGGVNVKRRPSHQNKPLVLLCFRSEPAKCEPTPKVI